MMHIKKWLKTQDVIIILIVITLVLPDLSGKVYASNEQSQPIKDVIYNIPEENTLKQFKSVFAPNEKLKTVRLNESVGLGQKITKIIFYKDDKELKRVTVNDRFFNQEVSFNGEKVLVKSEGNTGYGSWFAWQRYSAGEKGNFWYPGRGNYEALQGDPTSMIQSERCGPPYPETEMVSGIKMDKYPGCHVKLKTSYTRTKPYTSITYNYTFPTKVIRNDKKFLESINPVIRDTDNANPKIDKNSEVVINDIGISGTTDHTTKVVGLEFVSLDEAKIVFEQKYDHVGVKQDLPATGAAMMYYFGLFELNIQSYTYRYPNKMQVFYTDGECVGENCGGGDMGEMQCTVPVPGNMVTARHMDPKATAAIRADGMFDVVQGIPTSERLNTRVVGAEYLVEHQFVEMSGSCVVPVAVSKRYVMQWDPMQEGPPASNGSATAMIPDPQYEVETVVEIVKVKRPYSYWIIQDLKVYDIDRADVSNYALPGETVELIPDGYVPKVVSMERDESFEAHVYMPAFADQLILADETLQGGTQRPVIPTELALFESSANQVVPMLKVNNDQLVFDGKMLMDGSEKNERGETPSGVPQPAQISSYVLFQDQLEIHDDKPNVLHAPSTGNLSYTVNTSVHTIADLTFPIPNINPITVHTPTVIYAQISDDQPHNQKTLPNANRAALILGRSFVIAMPTDGQHATYPGYGSRDYAEYIARKEVRFPFDTYTSNNSFLPKGIWYSIPVEEKQTVFKLPVWVDEGDYTVEYRTFADNAPAASSQQRYANTQLSHHVATDSINVEVIGRLYDLRITDITDPKWEQVFRMSKGSREHTGNVYWTGLSGIDGDPRGNTQPYTLPVRPGSHPVQGYQQVAVKTGYTFRFDLKTIGNMFGPRDMIRIKPSFSWVNENGSGRQAVDVYKHTSDKLFVKLGSNQDSYMRQIALQERLRNVSDSHIRQTARSYYALHRNLMTLSEDSFVAAWLTRATQLTDIGGYLDLRLGSGVRTYIGPQGNHVPDSVDASRALASVQQWHGEYHVPSQIYIVPSGFDLSKKFGFKEDAPFLLRKGYLIINFDVETVRNGDLTNPHLQYIHAPLSNQWKREGYGGQIRLPNGAAVQLKDGDILFYHGDKSAQQDYSSTGTH